MENEKVTVRVLLCEDHAMFRQMVAGRLALMPDLEVVGEAADGRQALELARELRPDVAVMDLEMPGSMDGREALRRLADEAPGTRVLVLSGSEDEADVVDAVDGGAFGYVVKTGGVDELCDAIRRVGGSERYFSAKAAELMASRIARGGRPEESASLSERDLRVLQLAADGMTTREIGRNVNLSERRVKDILALAAGKLGASNRTNLIALAVSRGLVSVEDRAPRT